MEQPDRTYITPTPEPWPPLVYDEIRPTVDHLHRLSQIPGKYTLDQPFEPNWGSTLLSITPRGFGSPLLRAGDLLFAIEFEILDDRVTVAASTGRVSLQLGPGSVAGFYESFNEAVAPLGVPTIGSLSQPEIPGAPPLDQDDAERPYDPEVARRVWSALAHGTAALHAWQAPFRGHRPLVGLMWGGFDLSAARYNGRPVDPPADRPMFQQNGMTEEVVAVGLTFGDEFHGPDPGLYAYIAPPPDGIGDADFGVPDARWVPEAGLVALPWDAVRLSGDPYSTVLQFADAVYDVAVTLGGWPADLVGVRCEGWYASRQPTFQTDEASS